VLDSKDVRSHHKWLVRSRAAWTLPWPFAEFAAAWSLVVKKRNKDAWAVHAVSGVYLSAVQWPRRDLSSSWAD